MSATWQTVRVFISSTFRDMQAERDHLVKVVFPVLREHLEKDRIHLVDIDLRWGVTREQADNDRVLDLCLDQIQQCKPFFVGILGERYGWVPKEFPVEARRNFGWIQYHTGKSLTELEILHGVLNDPTMCERAFFYMRDAAFIDKLPEEQRKIYCERPTEEELRDIQPEQAHACAEDRRAKLRDLKARINVWSHARDPSKVFENYPCYWDAKVYDPVEQGYGRLGGLEAFGRRILEHLEQAIRTAPELAEHLAAVAEGRSDELAEELGYHEAFIESRMQVYVGRNGIHRYLLDYLGDRRRRPLLLVGGSGSGKSAILARLCRDLMSGRAGAHMHQRLVVPHFIGASPNSTNLGYTLRRFCQELRKHFNLTQTAKVEDPGGEQREEVRPWEIPDDPVRLPETFREMLGTPPGAEAVFIVDAVNQFDAVGRGQEMAWLPDELPPGVKVVVSCIDEPGRPQKALDALRTRGTPELRVQPLTDAERFEIVGKVPSLSAKMLDAAQTRLLLSNPATANPLFLLVALEELRGFGSFAKLNDKISSFPAVEGEEGLDLLFGQVLQRLELEVDKDTVSAMTSLVACSRMGLSETELSELLTQGMDKEQADRRAGDMYIALRQLRPYLLRRGTLVDFYHRNLYKAVSNRCLDVGEAERQRRRVHGELTDYFRNKADPVGNGSWSGEYLRGFSELAFHMFNSGSHAELRSLLMTYLWIRGRLRATDVLALIGDYELLKPERNEPLGLAQGALLLAAHVLLRDIRQLPTEITARLLNLSQPELVQLLFQVRQDETGPWLRSLTHSLTVPGGPLLRTLEGHVERVTSVAVTPDGRAISASGSSLGHYDNTLKVWDLGSGACLRTLAGHSRDLNAVAVMPDGRRAVSGSSDSTLKVWDLESGSCLRTLEGNGRYVYAVAVTPDGRRAVSASDDKSLKLWDVGSGACLRTLEGHGNRVWTVAVTPDGRRAVSGSDDDTVKVWDLESGACLRTLRGHGDRVSSVAVTPDGQRAVSGSADRTLKVWDLGSGACLRTLEGHGSYVLAVALTPDGRRAVSGSHDNDLKVWDLESGACLRTLEGHGDSVQAVTVTPDGRRAVSASDDKTLKVWDLESGPCLQTLGEHRDWVTAVAVTPDGRRAICSFLDSNDKSLTIWDVESGACLRTLEGHGRYVYAVAVTPDGRRAIWGSGSYFGSGENTLRVWDLESGACLRKLAGHSGRVNAIAVTSDGRRAVSGSADRTLKVWDLDSGDSWWLRMCHRQAGCLRSPEGQRSPRVIGWWLRMYDRLAGTCLRTLEGHGNDVRGVAVTPDGRRAISASYDTTLKIWDLELGTCLRTLEGHRSLALAVAVAPDGRRAVSGSADRTLKVWDLGSGACLRTLEGHGDAVQAVAVTPGGRRAVSVSDDKTLKVWDLEGGQIVATFTAEAKIRACAVAPDGVTVVAGDKRGQMHFLRLEGLP